MIIENIIIQYYNQSIVYMTTLIINLYPVTMKTDQTGKSRSKASQLVTEVPRCIGKLVEYFRLTRGVFLVIVERLRISDMSCTSFVKTITYARLEGKKKSKKSLKMYKERPN